MEMGYAINCLGFVGAINRLVENCARRELSVLGKMANARMVVFVTMLQGTAFALWTLPLVAGLVRSLRTATFMAVRRVVFVP